MLRGRSVLAVILGLGTLLGLLFVLQRIQVAIPPPSQMPGPVTIVAASLLVGLLSELPAGYVAGLLAPSRPLVHAAVVAFLGAVGLAAFVAQRGTPFSWAFALGTLQAPAIMVGAWLATRRRNRRES